MKLGLYSVYDKKADRYDTPFFAQTDLMAERKFFVNCQNDGSIMATFKNDFLLCRIGYFEMENGDFESDSKTIVEGAQINLEVK